MKKQNNKKWSVLVKNGLVVILILFLSLLAFSMKWFMEKYLGVTFATVIYQLFSPMKGVGKDLLISYLEVAGVTALFVAVIIIGLYGISTWFLKKYLITYHVDIRLFRHEYHFVMEKSVFFLKNVLFVVLPVIGLLCYIGSELVQIGFLEYIADISRESTIYEEYYTAPSVNNLTFPEKKRNLVLIYLESMENTFTAKSEGGNMEENLIPNLTQMAEDYVSFSNTDKLGGACVVEGSGWTMGALLTSSSGVNYKLPTSGDNRAGKYVYFLPGLTAMGDVLEQAGYDNYFVCGSKASFAGRDEYYLQHGSHTIFDRENIKEEITVGEEDTVYWGVNDRKLYEYARLKLADIADGGQPFNFTMITVDTHFPSGYKCGLCEDRHAGAFGLADADRYADVLECADRQIKDFVEWIQGQPWYENTTIVIVGDHTFMGGEFAAVIDEQFDRRVYNCFINSVVEPQKKDFREFCALDFFPTIMASLGASIEGDRLGLGVNLFSGRETLCEKLGTDVLDEQLGMYSKYYFSRFIADKQDEK